jgi:hypothetical protein
MTENMVRTQVYLPRTVYEQLKERAEREGITMAHQIREALIEYVAVEKDGTEPVLTADDPIWHMIGMLESGLADGSVNHDQYIYVRDWQKAEPRR